jgi:hypothetical protein
MDTHRDEARVQQSGCWVLKDLAEHVANRPSHVHRKMSEAVLRAMRKHSNAKDVKIAAESALRQLGKFDTQGMAKVLVLGRCGRMGLSTTRRALEAVREEE